MSVFDKFKKKTPAIPKNLCEVIKPLEKNEIIMKTMENKKVESPDDCKLGGKPYLPADFEWPTFKSADDGITRPLSFFCQINLAQVKPYDKDNVLPGRGMLYFFYECASSAWGFDPADNGAARVFYFENTDGFVPKIPMDLYRSICRTLLRRSTRFRKSRWNSNCKNPTRVLKNLKITVILIVIGMIMTMNLKSSVSMQIATRKIISFSDMPIRYRAKC